MTIDRSSHGLRESHWDLTNLEPKRAVPEKRERDHRDSLYSIVVGGGAGYVYQHGKHSGFHALRAQEPWQVERELDERLTFLEAVSQIKNVVETDPRKRGGAPVIRGTRVAVAQILAELAEDQTLSQIADDYRLKLSELKKILNSLALYLERSHVR